MENSPYRLSSGIPFLNEEWSDRQRDILDTCKYRLADMGFEYLAVPTSLEWATVRDQGIDSYLCYSHPYTDPLHVFKVLGGSAEQGILEYFKNQTVEPQKIYAHNTCMRSEERYEGLIRVAEFQKVEQFVFCGENEWQKYWDEVMNVAKFILGVLGLEYREVEVSSDKGYHIQKVDLEVKTKTYGWMETHSCAYFGDEQCKRFNILGGLHTISCTGVASPRILIPLMEKEGCYYE